MSKKKFRPKQQIGVGGLTLSKKAKRYVNNVLNSNRLSYGPWTQKFEKLFAEKHDCKYASFVNSGTDALRIGLTALKNLNKWKDGDEVIVPAITFIATSNVVLQNNMKPIFVDVDPRTYNIDPAKIEEKITNKTRAIIPVHLMGLPVDMDPILSLAKKYKLKIIEDSCETMFATYKGKKVGSLGDIGTFSTYVAHFLVTGVGGIATTNDPKLAIEIKSLMNHGRDSIYLNIDDDKGKKGDELYKIVSSRFRFIKIGYSARCTEMEAALGVAQLEDKNKIIKKRREIAEKYNKGLKNLEKYIQLPYEPDYAKHMYMLYPIVVKNDSKWGLVKYLEDHNIETRDLMPLLSQPIYKKIFGDIEKNFPVAKWINNSGFYIGCHQHISDKEVDYIIDTIHEYFKLSY